MAEDYEPKALVFPAKPVGDTEPKALVFPTKPADEEGPRPLDFSRSQRAPTMPMEKDAIPRALSFGNVPSAPSKPASPAEPSALKFGAPAPSRSQAEPQPRALKLPERSLPTASHGVASGGSTLDLHQIGHPTRQVRISDPMPLVPRAAPPRAEGPSNKVIGGDPRAPAIMTAAQAKDAALANDPRFRGRLERFLKLTTSDWLTWGDKEMRAFTDEAVLLREHTAKLSTANAVQWAYECEQSYSRPPGFLDRFYRSKPEYYRVRLEQARDILQKLDIAVAQQIKDMEPRLFTLRLDGLVLEVATTALTDANQKIIAGRRLDSLVQGQMTAMMIMQSFRDLADTIATQANSVSDRLNVTIPQWLIAMSKA